MIHSRPSIDNPAESNKVAKAISRIQKSLNRRRGPKHQRRLARRLDILLDLATEAAP